MARTSVLATCGTVAALSCVAALGVGFSHSAAAAPPANSVLPTITGTARAGETLTGQPGTWVGDIPMTFAYQWQRCDDKGAGCADATGGKSQTYVPGTADVGKTFRVTVTATNAAGSAATSSAVTPVVAAAPVDAPAVTAVPVITGTPVTPNALTVSNGTWSGAAPLTYAYAWQKCDANGGACAAVASATQASYTLQPTDAGATFRAVVTASNTSGSATATTVPTAVIAAGQTGIENVPSGGKSIPVETLALPQRLLIDRVTFQPPELRTRAAFSVKVRVKDTRGFLVRGAKVFILGVPYSRVATVPEVTTGQDGTVTFKVVPTAGLELGRGKYLVFFVRATGTSGSTLAGISTRRLVQLRTGPPA